MGLDTFGGGEEMSTGTCLGSLFFLPILGFFLGGMMVWLLFSPREEIFYRSNLKFEKKHTPIGDNLQKKHAPIGDNLQKKQAREICYLEFHSDI